MKEIQEAINALKAQISEKEKIRDAASFDVKLLNSKLKKLEKLQAEFNNVGQ